jgi:hypothetical protein
VVHWGNLSGPDTGQGNYNLVRLELFGADVPALPLWAAALIAVVVMGSGLGFVLRLPVKLQK